MRITSKGQVTIPLWLREKAGLVPGSEVEFYEERGLLCIRRVEGKGRGRALVEKMAGKGRSGMSTDEIMALTRGED